MRHGCRSLVQLEILPKPPLERAADNPWPQWPKVYKLDYGQEEAAALFGADPREYCDHRPSGSSATTDGHVKAIHTVRIEWVKDNGRFAHEGGPGLASRSCPPSSCCWPWASSARSAGACSTSSG